jgi:hypothetical protein
MRTSVLASALVLGLVGFAACNQDDSLTPEGEAGAAAGGTGKGGSGGSGGSNGPAAGKGGKGGGSAGRGGAATDGGAPAEAGAAGENHGGRAAGTGGSAGAGDAGAAGSGEEPPILPLFALTTQVFGADAASTQSYVLLASSLDSPLDLADAVLEIPGRALGTGPIDGGRLYVAGDAGPTVTRYDLTPSGGLDEHSSISFLGKGVSEFGEYGGQFQYVSEDKAYWFDPGTAQIVIWDPEAMRLTGDIALSELAFEGEGLSFTAVPVRDEQLIYSFASWRTGPTPIAIPDRAGVVVLDTETDEATVVLDTRCGYVRDGVLAPDGYLYLATEAIGAAVNFLNFNNASAPCLLRFDTETRTFDAEFKVELSSLFDGATGGSLVVAASGQAFLRFLDEQLLPADPEDPVNLNPRFLASAPVWRWAHFTPGSEPTVEPLDTAATTGSVLPFRLGDRTLAPLFSQSESTRLIELTDTGLSEAASASVPGLVFSAVKLK